MDVQFRADPALVPYAVSGGVRFILDAAPGTRSVALARTFNSWAGDACMLERVSPTRWQAVLPVPAGRHLYKFVVDGTAWIVDPANPWVSEDGQNNSCLTVDGTGAVLMRHAGLSADVPRPLYARQALASPAWLRDGVIYQLSVPAFGGDFAGVRAKLPYLGDAASLRALVDAAHPRGMRVVLDRTLNRSSIDHPFTRTHPHWYTRRADGSIYYAVPNREAFAGFDFGDRALRRTLIDSMRGWNERIGIDGLRFDDADITPCDFLDEIRAALAQVRPDIALIAQSYDEFHHLAACDLTYEGGTREMLRHCERRRGRRHPGGRRAAVRVRLATSRGHAGAVRLADRRHKKRFFAGNGGRRD